MKAPSQSISYLEKTRGRVYRFVADRVYLLAVKLHVFLLKVLGRDNRYYVRLRHWIKTVCVD